MWSGVTFSAEKKIYISVGTEADESLERMVEWFSDNYDMSINVLVLKYTKAGSLIN